MFRRAMVALLCVFAAVILCAGCDGIPRDPESSLRRVLERGTLRVGASEAPPWVVRGEDGSAGGAEGVLVTEFACSLGVEIEWRWDSAERNLVSLEAYELDVVVAGLSKASPWSKRAGMTMPYYTVTDVVGVDPLGPVLEDLDGVTVGVRPASALARTLRSRGATPVEHPDLRRAPPPVACARWEAQGMGLRSSGIELGTREQVMAVPLGENALLMRLESFLLDHAGRDRVERLLWDWSRR